MSTPTHPFLAGAAEGVPVEPVLSRPLSPSGPTLPHTTLEKAALCDALLPFLTGLREAIWAVTVKQPRAEAGDDVIMMAQILLADVRRLVRGESMSHYVDRLTITSAPHDRLGLSVKLQTMETAVKAFRRRYFGYNPLVGRPAWLLCGDTAVEDARRLLPPDETPPPKSSPMEQARMAEWRDKLVHRFRQLAEETKRTAPPVPLHAPGPETPHEIVFKDWPEPSHSAGPDLFGVER